MSAYKIGAGSRVQVKARSKIHDTTTVWDRVQGDVEATPDTLATAGAKARFTVDMTQFDAGDWIKNRKIRSDFDMDGNPEAIFELRTVRDVKRQPNSDRFTATADGTLRWRGREVTLTIQGQGTMTATSIDATGTFDLDIKQLGLKAPRFLMFKMEDEVTVEVTLRGAVT
jgi:polyisoprenoid-binding protein YceI